MEKLREILIVSDAEDRVWQTYFGCFMDWIGIIHHDHICMVDDRKFKNVLSSGNNKFDIILYINEKDNRNWQTYFSKYGKLNISLDCKNDTPYINSTLNSSALYDFFKQIYLKDPSLSMGWDIMKKLIDIYCEKDVLHFLFEFSNSIFMVCDSISDYMSYRQKMIVYSDKIKNIIDDLEKLDNNIFVLVKGKGLEYVKYSGIYSNWISNIYLSNLNVRTRLTPEELIEKAEMIYKLDSNFYNVELLKAKISPENRSNNNFYRIFYNNCQSDFCRSLACYHIGCYLQRFRYNDEVIKYLEKSYNLNKLNYKTIFALASMYKKRQKNEDASLLISELFTIIFDDDDIDKNSILELKYIMLSLKLAGWCAGGGGNQIAAYHLLKEALQLSNYNIEEIVLLKKLYGNNEIFPEIVEDIKKQIISDADKKRLIEEIEFSKKAAMWCGYKEDSKTRVKNRKK